MVLETTGGTHTHLVAELGNPRQVRDLARATGNWAKTDALDAQVLAHFAEPYSPNLGHCPMSQCGNWVPWWPVVASWWR